MEPGLARTVHVVPPTHGEFQSLYLDREANWLRPNLTFVASDGTALFDTNEVGLKGDPLDPRRKLAVVWGDSVVFGIGRSWPALLDAHFPQFQFLNGGIEGNYHRQVLDRAIRFNREHRVALNLVMIGWHTFEMNDDVRRDLIAAMAEIPNPVLLTMPTSLNAAMISQDLAPSFAGGNLEECFYFFGNMEHSLENQGRVFEHIRERNRIVGEVATQLGIPLIDFFAAFDSERLADFRQDFFDVAHPRPSAYPRLAQTVAAGIAELIETGWEYRAPRPAAGAEPAAGESARPWLAAIRRVLSRRRAPG